MFKINLDKPILDIRGKAIEKSATEKGEKKEMRIRDYLLTILSTRFPVVDKKEVFWTTQLGILFSDEENSEAEVSDDKAKFLRRIIENNKVTIQNPMGEKEIELFFPFERSQLLQLFLTEEEKKQLE